MLIVVARGGYMRRKKVNLEHIRGLLTVLIPRMEETTKRQLLSLIFLVTATILEYIRGLLTVLMPKMEDSTKRQIHSLVSLVMATMFFTTPFVTTVGATPSYIHFVKNATSVTGNGTPGNVTAAGDIISYRLNVTHTGDSSGDYNRTNVTVTDLMLGNLTGPTIENENNSGGALGDLDPGESWIFFGNYTVQQIDINSNGSNTGFINNTANITVIDYDNSSDTTYGSASNYTPIIWNPSYSINKTVTGVTGNGNGNVTAAGNLISYNVNVTNNGNIDLTNVNVTDPKIGINNVSNLGVGNSTTFSGIYNVTQADINSNGNGTGFIINNATVICDQLGLLNDNATTPIIQNANYTIDKNVINVAGQGPGGNVTAAGQVISYNVNVTNSGNIDLTNVTVNDPLLTGNFTGNNDTILNPGESWIFTGNYSVSQADINNNGNGTGLIINNATVDCDQLGLLNDNATTRIIQNANSTIVKTVIGVTGNGNGNVTAAGDIVSYRVNVTNSGNIDLTNVTVTDPLIGNFTGFTKSINNDTVLNTNETWTYTGNYTVQLSDINSNGNGTGYITNNATVDAYQLDPKNATVQTPIANYTIVKTVTGVTGSGNGNVTVEGDVISYNVNVTNNGKVDLTNVTVTDPLIGNFTGLAKSINNDTVLNAGEIWTYTGNYTVSRLDINNYGNDANGTGFGTGFIINNATVTSDQLGPKNSIVQIPIDTACSIDGEVIDVAGQGPDGTVTAAGDVITYQIDVTNEGITNITNVTVDGSLAIPMGPTSSNNNDTVLNANETWTYIEMYTVTQTDIDNNGTVEGGLLENALASENEGNGLIINTVTFDSDQLGPKSYSNEVPLERNSEPPEPQRNADISIIKSVISPDEDGDCIVNSAGDEIPYRIMVTNEGDMDLTNVEVSDSLVDLPEPTGDDNYDGVLNVGETWRYDVIYKLTADDVDNGYVYNIATVSCDQLPEKTASVSTPVDKNADLSIYKSIIGIDEDGNQKIDNVGDVINYQVAVKNNGNIDLTDVSVDDQMVDLSKSDGDHNDPGVLNPGETWVYTGDYSVTQEDIDSVDADGFGYITNTATVSCDELSSESSYTELQFFIGKKLPNVNPVADFSASVTSGNAPLTVQFTDKSTGSPTSWSWDFNNDGVADSSVANPPAYIYSTPGTYVAKLTVSDANGLTDSKTETINVLQPPITTPTPTSTSGGGGHGGSTGTANVVSSGSTDTSATVNVTQPETNTSIVEQSTPVNVVQTPTPKATSTPAKKSTKTPGFEIIFGITALLGAVFICRRR